MSPIRVRCIQATIIAFNVILPWAFAQHLCLHNTTDMNWPSLRFHITIHRAASRIHGVSEFSVLANPILSSNATGVIYDTFTSYEEEGMLFNYSLVNGVEFVSRRSLGVPDIKSQVHCIETETLLPINSIVAALNEAESVSYIVASDGTPIACSGGSSFKTLINGIPFGICFYGSSGFNMYGSDMDIKVEYMTTDTPILAPALNATERRKCRKSRRMTVVTSIGNSLLTGRHLSIKDARKLKAAFDFSLSESSCACKSTPRPCVFIHGLGSLTEEKENLDSFQYWGNLTDHTPCCSSTKFAVLNTLNYSWTDAFQQQKVCDRMLNVSDTSDGTIVSDTIIISHSMGGLLVAGAIANGKCRLDTSSTWISTGTPMRGSMASDYFQKSCKDETNVVMEKFVETTGYCPADDGIKSLAYIDESYCTSMLIEAYKAAQQVYRDNVYAVMCSDSFSGLLSTYQVAFWLLGKVVSHKSLENDGMVEFNSCAGGIPKKVFGASYKDRFYMSNLNHNDVAFRAGDALFDTKKMPVKWLECLL